MSDGYDVSDAVPSQLENDLTGPKHLALVRAWPDGRTDVGWGLTGKDGSDGFMPRYMRGEFDPRRVLFGYNRGRWAFAFIMRSVQLVCLDIDGKNGGITHAGRLGMLPPTMAETSKSGTGYHLWYRTDEVWDPVTGFAGLNDRIGLEQGVDFRAVGCVYHHPQQRWNHRAPAMLPVHLFTMLRQHDQQLSATSARIAKVLSNQDEMEILMMRDELVADLSKPIPTGKRNTTLFAIGTQMYQAGVSDWDELVTRRGDEIGLDPGETAKIVENIGKYGASLVP